ncbi:MAG: DUF2269 family protein [Candidatus Eisenbacteria bacterium]
MTEVMRILHVFGAVVLIGDLLFAGFWLSRAVQRGDTGLRAYVLATMAWTSKSYALPAILVNLIAGLALIHFKETPMATALWLWIALVLYVVVTGLWHGVLIPRRKKMAALFGEPEKGAKAVVAAGAAGDFDSMARAWLGVNGVTVLILFVILALMVWRPTL